MATKTVPATPITLRSRLTRLTPKHAAQLLGPKGAKLIQAGGKYTDIDIDKDVYFRGDLFRLKLRSTGTDREDIVVTLTLMADKRKRITWNCDHCETACEHVGAAFSLILEDKYTLGLSAIPKEGVPLERLSEDILLQRALAERTQRAKNEGFRLKSTDTSTPWTDYVITSVISGKSYRIALRGTELGDSYCSCPDFRVNTLGTCKHILYALTRVQKKFPAAVLQDPYQATDFAIHLRYGAEVTLWLGMPFDTPPDAARIVRRLAGKPITNVPALLRAIRKLEAAGHDVIVYPDAEQWIQQRLFQQRVADLVTEIRQDPERHPLRRELLRTELLPYQLDGIAFAVGAGRAVLADDMGLGKTIQGIGVAELMSRVADVSRVLVVCPASLKSQWRSEIHRFSDRDCQIVIGSAEERWQQYAEDHFFTVCNYEQVMRDVEAIDQVKWDLIILDEGQRIKNWESKTANCIKALKSPFALVLSGTPLENRLAELYSVVQFIDDRRLSPAFRFFHRHRVVDERGKIIGYKNLDQLRDNLRPILLRRTRQSVLNELPERTTQIVRIPPTAEQKRISDTNMQTAAQIAAKKFITEMDLLRLQKALLMARMACDSTFLVDKQPPGFSSKLEYLADLIEQLFAEPNRKGVLFSEWTTMLNLIEPILEKNGIDYVRLDGSVPQRKRQQLVNRFQNDSACRLFITTNAGSTGLNLQAANTVINVDLPWNPAVLEQRIARAHRMGQKNPVDVYLLVTDSTMEERLLVTLADKRSLALAALELDSDVTSVDFKSGLANLKERLEVLLGPKPVAPVSKSSLAKAEQQAAQFGAHRQRVAAAGGQLLGAVFDFLGELVNENDIPQPPSPLIDNVRNRLDQCVEEDDQGHHNLTISLPNRDALDKLAKSLATLLVASGADDK